MAEIFNTINMYMAFPFVRYALIVGVLIALCSSLLGATLVLKRLSYIGDGLSHIAFGATAVAATFHMIDQNILVFPITALAAIMLLKIGQNTKINGDAAIAMLSVGSLAIGYLIMNLFPSSNNLAGDACTTLFGATSILTLEPSDVITCVALSVLVITIFVVFYNKIFSVTFDENFARATGIKADLYNLIVAVTIAAVIVVAMNLVGTLLISALVVFPALSSMRIFKNFRAVIISSMIISVLCAFFGMMISIVTGTPVGSTIVVANIIVFLLCSLIALIRDRNFN